MSGALIEKVFSVSRDDLLFDYASKFGDAFKFSAFSVDEPTPKVGVCGQQALGYDFQNEYSPIVEVSPIKGDVLDGIGLSSDDLTIHISVEDTSLAIRKSVASFSLSSVSKPKRVSIQLKEFKEMSFLRGFEIQCVVSRSENVAEKTNIIWHKSQVIHESTFVVKASTEEALFEIDWTNFQNEGEDKETLYFVEWMSCEVSTLKDVGCFQVKANRRLRDQFKRMENNKHFGEMCIRMIAYQILRELLNQTLKYARIDDSSEPEPESLHDKFRKFLDKHGEDFDSLAAKAQSREPLDRLTASSEITKLLQRVNGIGSALEGIMFGRHR